MARCIRVISGSHHHVRPVNALILLCVLVAASVGCENVVSTPEPVETRAPLPSESESGPAPLDPPTFCETGDYVAPTILSAAAKVKTVLSGEALSQEEATTLNADPTQLRALIATWASTLSAREKLLAFFQQSFQQEGFEDAQLAAQFDEVNLNGQFGRVSDDSEPVGRRFAQNVREMFPRTVLAMIDAGEPFNTTLTTRSFMLTPALMTFLAFHDEQVITEGEDNRGRQVIEYPGTIQQISLQNLDAYDPTDHASARAFGLFDPSSANFMRFYSNDPQLISASAATGCTGEVVQTLDDDAKLHKAAFRMYLGTLRSGFAGDCREPGGAFSEQRPGFLAPDDFNTWRRVTIRAPQAGEETARFYELERFRDPNVTEIVLNTPRIGFMTTLGFFSVWETNPDNQARVTANQLLITAFGHSIDDSDVNFPVVDAALDGEHADPTTTCYACHRSLDPLRQYFRRDYTYFSSRQTDPEVMAVDAGFAWGGNDLRGGDVNDLAEFLSTQVGFAEAWVQKLCYFANSEPCPEDSDSFATVADAFRASNYNFLNMLST
ncbi:MAG: hypothetical protein AAF658_02600, partial [Myxococcota bacterium]